MTLEIQDLGFGPSEEEQEELRLEEEAEAEAEAVAAEDETFVLLDPEMAGFVDELVKRTILFCEELWGETFYPYQRAAAYRLIESLVLQDAEEITGLWARQSGKSETVATTLAGCMILFPILAKTYPIMERFKRGLWVGLFAPVDEQSDIVYSRLITRLSSERVAQFLQDPEIATKLDAKSRVARLSNGSLCRRQTANPRAKIEGSTYHIIVIDECQDADTLVIRKSIHPMLASTGGSIVKIGTVGYHKGDFYSAINLNKRRARGRRTNHFEYDYRIVSKYNPAYKLFIDKEKFRLGEDSEEFRMCVAPETRVLTADLRHIPASEIYTGMKLVGFDEHRPGKGLHRNFKETTVEHVWRVTRPSYRVEMSDGTSFIASSEHPWLVLTPGGRTEWRTTEKLYSNDRIFKLTDVWAGESTTVQCPDCAGDSDYEGEFALVCTRCLNDKRVPATMPPTSYETGYLAGVYDGEGSISSSRPGQIILNFSQNEGGVLDRVRKYLADAGFTWWERTQPNGCVNVVLSGGRAAVLRFLGQIRPQRLLDKFDIKMLGSIGRHDHKGQDFQHPHPVRKTFIGDQELIAFQTSTRTFVAEGLASHNSYALHWMLDRGMLVSEDDLDALADRSMPLMKAWHRTPCVVGIDPARVKDSTVVTVMWVDWDHPDPAGYREHRILNWLEIHNTAWEEQYFEICDFLEPYLISHVGVDAQGMGSAVADRMQRLLGNRCEVTPYGSDAKNQSERWKHLIQLIQRQMLIYPGHSKARRTRVWRRFRQQMSDAEKIMKGQYLLIEAPHEKEAHDDFVDSAALACATTMGDSVPLVEVIDSPFYK